MVAAFGQSPSPLDPRDAKSITPLQGQTHHVQGIETDGSLLWVTSVDRTTSKGFLFEYDLASGRLLRQIEIQNGERFHPGGLAADETSLWIPVAEYKANSSAIIQRRDKRTLELISQFQVPDHIGCIAVTPEFIIGGNWDSRDFYLWDRTGKLIRKVSSQTGNAYQDLKFDGGFLIGAGSIRDRGGAIDWMELPSFRLTRRVDVGQTDRGASLTREGMMSYRGSLWFLPEDDSSRLFEIPLMQLR
jgi:hypothetical protein